MGQTEENVQAWVVNMWTLANRYEQVDDWKFVCDALYGALQACIHVDAMSDYTVYSLLANVARQRRMDCITSKYKEAA